MADFVFKFMIRANDLIRVTLSNHKRRHLVVVMDQAPCHTSKMAKKFIESKKRLENYLRIKKIECVALGLELSNLKKPLTAKCNIFNKYFFSYFFLEFFVFQHFLSNFT